MSEREVIKMVTGQLQHDFANYKNISGDSKNKCIRMIMDFLDKSKAEATKLLKDKVVPNLKLYSGEFSSVKYVNDGSEIYIECPNEGIKINLPKEKLDTLGNELKKLKKSLRVLED